jgi:hypothetical protein
MDKDQGFQKGKADPAFQPDLASGNLVDPGPYEAVVLSHVQGTRMGQLLVWVPDWGGTQSNPTEQAVVSYASPFYGKTFGTDSQTETPGAFTSGQSYGMWMVPPDVGNKVLVTFAAGDRSRGYWFACIYDSPSHHMVPAVSRNIGGSKNTQIDASSGSTLQNAATSSSILPVVEYDTNQSTAFSDLVNTPRIAHPVQSMILIGQGLDTDPVRGAISSSSMREAPSTVFGISTPGQSATSTPQAASVTDVNGQQTVIGRLGGHSFVMDDGDPNNSNAAGNPVDKLIRLRTAGGHQILMNDSEELLYIASASGQQWLEFSNDGMINMYGMNGINMRTQGILNLQGDQGVLINSGGSSAGGGVVEINGDLGVAISSTVDVSVQALGEIIVSADAALSLTGLGAASLASGGLLDVGAVGICNISGSITNLTGIPKKFAMPTVAAPKASLPDVSWGGQNWQFSPGSIQSICTMAPSHEPWIDPSTGQRPAPQAPSGKSALIGTVIGVAVGGAYGFASSAIGNFFKGGSSASTGSTGDGD